MRPLRRGRRPGHRPDFLWPILAEDLGRVLAETTLDRVCRDAAGAEVPREGAGAPMYFI